MRGLVYLSLVWSQGGKINDELWSPSLLSTNVPSGSMALEIQNERFAMDPESEVGLASRLDESRQDVRTSKFASLS